MNRKVGAGKLRAVRIAYHNAAIADESRRTRARGDVWVNITSHHLVDSPPSVIKALLRRQSGAVRCTMLSGQIPDLTSLRRGRVAWLVIAGIVGVEYRACGGAVAVRTDCTIVDLVCLVASAMLCARCTSETH